VGAKWLDELGAARGAIVLTAHMGSYDLGAALFAEKFHREIRVVRAPEPDQQSAEHLSAALEKAGESGVKVAYNTAGALLSFDLLKALRDGEIVSIQGDRADERVAQVKARLFGHDVLLPNGPFVLGLIAQVPIYPLFIARAGCRSYQIIVRAPIRLESSGQREQDLARGVNEWCDVLQEIVAARWDQWFAFTPVFTR
jgi:lauroyl/myristoyl acyltransferase